ncbi:MAG: hypothetical protein GY788_27980 [bacterium]|nr:hypothetical protein [bacterium]
MSAPDAPAPDLTRWNRAGLERFRYVGANAVTLLETLRAELAEEFPDWNYVSDAARDIPVDETDAERQQRILDRYRDNRQDWGWEIARTFARAAHILTEHADAFANEGFIATATQWEYLRRLVAMLDYRPLPPASAATTIALNAKNDVNPGPVAAGFQVKHSPQDGGAPVIFETLDELEIDPGLNTLMLDGWNHNPNGFDPFEPLGPDNRWLLAEGSKVSVGQPAVLISNTGSAATGDDALAVLVDALDEEKLAIATPGKKPESGRVVLKRPAHILGDTELLIEPEGVRAPALNGPDVLRLPTSTGVSEGQVIGWRKGDTTGFARIVSADRFGIAVTDVRPSGEDISGGNVTLLKALRHDGQMVGSSREFRFGEDGNGKFSVIGANEDGSLQDAILEDPNFGEFKQNNIDSYWTLPFAGTALYFLDNAEAENIAISKAPLPETVLEFEGGSADLATGDWLVAEGLDGATVAVRIETIKEREDSFSLVLSDAPKTLRGIARLHGPFATHMRPDGHDRNARPVTPANLVLELGAGDLPPGLTAGKTVVIDTLEPRSGAVPFAASIASVVAPKPRRSSDHPRLVLDAPAERFAGFEIGSFVIRANAVLAGHGETKSEITLGSGDAARTGQTFTLAKDGISFVADAVLEAGVRAALVVRVDDRIYEEVSTLVDSESYDAHYTTEMTEDGHVRIRFGDGMLGRRLPTGRSNVKAEYRTGTGAAGNNLPPGSLEKPVKPHPLVDAVHQPIATSGGQDMQDLAGIRANAPTHLRTLGRGVSLADFEHLARNQPGIWHAKAFHVPRPGDRRENVELAVVPADGSPLGDFGNALEERLALLAPPGVAFRVTRFDQAPLDLALTLRIDSTQFDPDMVVDDVRAAAYQALSLERRAPGQPVYLSEIYEVTESVTGVHSSDAKLFAGQAEPILSESGAKLRTSRNEAGQVWAVWPTDRQDVFVAEPAAITIMTEELTL